jgi:nucleoporin GLE1
MSGLARGYAAISLRDFSKSKNENPYPPVNYWKTISYLVNTPPPDAQPTHFIVLRELIQGYVARFVKFYGHAALAALRKALVEFPAAAPSGPARDAITLLPEQLHKELGLTL